MRIGMFTDSLLAYDYEKVLDTAVELGIRDLEIGTGNYSPAPHCNLQAVLHDKSARQRWLEAMERRGLSLYALNCSGNPLHPEAEYARRHDGVLRDTLRLAGELGLERIVTMSGCPGTAGGSSAPHFAAGGWLPDFEKIAEWQWSEVILPYWEEMARFAHEQGVARVCLELHPGMSVYNTATLQRLRASVGSGVMANLDPSHLFWQQMDPLAVIAALGDAIGYVHAKDTRLDAVNMALNGLLDSRWPGAPKDMPWNFCTMGFGHDATYWKGFVLTLLAHGYDGVLGIEHEDPLLDPLDGVQKSVTFLKEVIPAEH